MSSRSPTNKSLKSVKTLSQKKKSSPFDQARQGSLKGKEAPSEIYNNIQLQKNPSPTASKTNDKSQMNNTMTTEWKTGLSPRAKNRIQIALPTDNTTDYNEVPAANRPDANTGPTGDLTTKKEFAQTGNFPARLKNFGLHSGGDKRKTVYNNGTDQ